MTWLLRLGAFDVALEECAERHRGLLEGLYRARFEPMPADGPIDLRLTIRAGHDGAGFGASDALESWEAEGRIHFASDVVAGHLDREPMGWRLALRIDEGHPHVRFLDHYLRILLNSVLRRLDRIRLHAAAARFAGATSMFVGDKGAGKTTICLQLARGGGTVLAEDQVMVRRTAQGDYVVAGGDSLMRLTGKTEAYFFPAAIQAPTVTLAGVSKKEVQAHDFIACEPNREYPPDRIFFPEVGRSFGIRTLTGRETLLRLAAPILPTHRFTNDADRHGFIAFLAGLVERAKGFSLTLTPDLADLDRLSEFLS